MLLDSRAVEDGELARLLDLRGGRHLGLVLALVSVVARRERCRRDSRFLAVPRRVGSIACSRAAQPRSGYYTNFSTRCISGTLLVRPLRLGASVGGEFR